MGTVTQWRPTTTAPPSEVSAAERIHRRFFGTLLSELRTTARLTQEDLASRSGLSVRAIRNVETGRTERPRRRTCELLAQALGLSGPDSRRLLAAAGWGTHQLTTEPWSSAFPPAAHRSELPLVDAELVGRKEITAALAHYLAGDVPAPGPVRLATITGPPGSGKTALVAQVAHLVRDRFPDGQIFVDLDSSVRESLPPVAVTARLLRSLGVDSVPETAEECGALLRALLGSRRVLVVLDNADGEAQIRPLLGQPAGGAVLVASRQRLPALPAGVAAAIGPLSERDAARLLEGLIGKARMATDAAAVRAIIEFCGRLPLALRIAGLWIAARPHRGVRELAGRLEDERYRLDYLRVGDLSLRSSVAACFRRLTAVEQEAMRRLAVARGPFGPHRVAPLLKVSRATAADLLDELAQRQMLQICGPPDLPPNATRYLPYDTVRLYAAWSAGGVE
ncbi:helix-turn-helix domain-containing protein [Streptomyces sp. AA0539]|uniref:helix-turn-helix domain-containing protein n=1 Tax=Streptomyces sp. AA0539 TaxID=1210045 RepID=UPI0002F1C75E|nr:helix-turn-helix domain-containing protein [Streptomyces sp. AA0539]